MVAGDDVPEGHAVLGLNEFGTVCGVGGALTANLEPLTGGLRWRSERRTPPVVLVLDIVKALSERR